MKCPASFSFRLALGDDLVTLTCDLEEGHDNSLVFPPELAHYDALIGLYWLEPSDHSNVLRRIKDLTLGEPSAR